MHPDKISEVSWIYDFYQLGQKSISGQDSQAILDEILSRITQSMDGTSATLATRDEEGNVRIAAVLGLDSCLVGQVVKPNEGVFGRMLRQPASMFINGPVYDADTVPVPGRKEFPTSSIIWPLLIDDRLIGMLSVNNKTGQRRFNQDDLQHGQVLVNLVTFIIENIRQHEASKRRIQELTHLNREIESMNLSLKETQARLLQAEKMAAVGRVSAGIAHEINNPLAFVRSNLGVLKDYLSDVFGMLDHCLAQSHSSAQRVPDTQNLDFLRQDISSLLEESRTGIDRVATIVKNLREISHPGIIKTTCEVVDLGACVTEALKAVQAKLPSQIRLLRCKQEWPSIMGSSSMIIQILTNLLTNAGQAIEGEGCIEIGGGESVDTVWIEVADSGKGIEPADLPRIFEPFYTTREVGEGMGLGLALSYRFAEYHGGRLEVESAVGQGTRFRLVLPRR